MLPSDWEIRIGAEEGTRTPTPLRVHGPEPCASANSATSALNEAPDKDRRLRREILIYFKGFAEGVKSAEIGESGDRQIIVIRHIAKSEIGFKAIQSVNPRSSLPHHINKRPSVVSQNSFYSSAKVELKKTMMMDRA